MRRAACAALIALSSCSLASARSLRDALGRNEVRVYAAPYRPALGSSVDAIGLAARLERMGYGRVRRRPETPGEFFWGHDVFWIFRRPARGRPARLLGLELERSDGSIVGYRSGADAKPSKRSKDAIELEPELLATSLTEPRSVATWVPLERLPVHVWRPLLAIEDARFFDHHGVDGRAVARALLANVRSGEVVQGGSTITQQLIKLRDLSSKRTLGRKASEAFRALTLEAEHTKEEILEGYLNSVYYGHTDGISLYGIEAAAQAYYSVAAERLTLPQAAALAALVQSPNRLSPLRHPERLAERYRLVLGRLEELEWAPKELLERARQALPPTRPGVVRRPPAPHYLRWLASEADHEEGRGIVIEATLDIELQAAAESAVRRGLDSARRRRPSLRDKPLAAALVALDATTGDVLAYVGGDPDHPGDFDRARRGRRQPGSTVKPLVALEALDSCGSRSALFPSRRVHDTPLSIALPSGAWEPLNADRTFRGTVTVRQALAQSLNVPLVRIARHCGFDATARRLRRAGLELPRDVQPAFVLGAVETSPLELAAAYSLFLNGGEVHRPQAIRKAWTPRGRQRLIGGGGSRHVASSAASYMVWDLLRRDDLPLAAFGKTGTSSEERDAWYAGGAGRVVAAVWIGLDDDRSLGLSGAEAALPIWTEFMRAAAPSRGPFEPARPSSLIEHWVDVESGLRLAHRRDGAEQFLFRRRARPPKKRLWRRRSPLVPVE